MRAPFFFLFIIWSNKYCNEKCTILSTRCSSLKIIRMQNRAIILETSYSTWKRPKRIEGRHDRIDMCPIEPCSDRLRANRVIIMFRA